MKTGILILALTLGLSSCASTNKHNWGSRGVASRKNDEEFKKAPSPAVVKEKLKGILSSPDQYVTKWLRMITETNDNGRWGGISEDFEVVYSGSSLDVDRHGDGSETIEHRYLMIYLEKVGHNSGYDQRPLVFEFSLYPDGTITDFIFKKIIPSGLTERVSSLIPTGAEQSPDTNAEISKELLGKSKQDLNVFESGNGAAIDYAVGVIENNAINSEVPMVSKCGDKPKFKGIAMCSWGYKSKNKTQMIDFEIYTDNYVNGANVGKWGEILPGTVKYRTK